MNGSRARETDPVDEPALPHDVPAHRHDEPVHPHSVLERPDQADGRGTLYIVSTPIGNLGDVTLRALEVLRAVPLVAAEDTRITRRLWARYEISTRLVSYHAHSRPSRTTELLAHLERGEDLALVTDAGTPLVSDPGGALATEWADRGGLMVPIPGASAVLAALVASAVPAPRWSFEGFLPRGGRERRSRLGRLGSDDRATVLFEAAPRVRATLLDLVDICGADRAAAVCRELTKRHEEVWRGTLAELADRTRSTPPRGEVTIVVAGAPMTHETEEVEEQMTMAEAQELVDRLVADGQPRSAAAREVARRTGLPRRDLFRSS